jgi:hypothetical protein
VTAPRNARSQPGGGRKYVWHGPEGVETFPSVTTILGRVLHKPAITPWALRTAGEYVRDTLEVLAQIGRHNPDAVVQMVKQAPWELRDRAADKGTLVHALAEAFTLGQEPKVPDELRGHLDMWHDWVERKHVRFLMAEATVYSRNGGWAGTLDAIAETDDGVALIDYKTGKDVYPDTALQLTALRYAEFVGLPDGTDPAVPDVDLACVVRLAADDWDMVPMALDRNAWESLVGLYRWTLRDDIVGPSLGGPERML